MNVRIVAVITRLAFALVWGSLPLMADDPSAAVKNLSAAEAIKLVGGSSTTDGARSSREAVTVLDVRTADEFADGHIKAAINLDFRAPDFEQKLGQLDKSRPYLVHCGGGGRSSKARDLMQKLGFKKINHLDGGFTAWKKSGGPIVVDKKAAEKK